MAQLIPASLRTLISIQLMPVALISAILDQFTPASLRTSISVQLMPAVVKD